MVCLLVRSWTIGTYRMDVKDFFFFENENVWRTRKGETLPIMLVTERNRVSDTIVNLPQKSKAMK